MTGADIDSPAAAARNAEFTAFVESAGTGLRRSAYLMCRDWHLAQDLTQQSLAKMYASWSRIRTNANLEAYSRRVLMNTVFDHYRRRSGFEIALARLTVQDRAVLVLRHAEDHSVETVAAILRLSVPAVKMRNARALARLRTLLGEDFADYRVEEDRYIG